MDSTGKPELEVKNSTPDTGEPIIILHIPPNSDTVNYYNTVWSMALYKFKN